MKIKTLKQREKDHLSSILNKTSWDIDKSAHLLKIPKEDVLLKIEEFGFSRESLNKTPDKSLVNKNQANKIHANTAKVNNTQAKSSS